MSNRHFKQSNGQFKGSRASLVLTALSLWLGISSGAGFAADSFNAEGFESPLGDSMTVKPVADYNPGTSDSQSRPNPFADRNGDSEPPSGVVRAGDANADGSSEGAVPPSSNNVVEPTTPVASPSTKASSENSGAAANDANKASTNGNTNTEASTNSTANTAGTASDADAAAAPAQTTTTHIPAPAAIAAPVARPAAPPLSVQLAPPPNFGKPAASHAAVNAAVAKTKAQTAAQIKAAAAKALAGHPVIKTTASAPLTPQNEDVLKEVFALTEKTRTPETMDRIFVLEKDGQAFFDKHEYLKALVKFQDMYAECKEVKFGDGEGRALERMASVYLGKGEKTRAKSLVENSMEVLGNSQDKKSLGRTRVTAAQVYLALDNPLWALKQLDLAMKDFSSSAVTDADEAARAMLLAAELAVKVDEPKEAIKFYKAAAVYFGECGKHEMEVCLHNTCAGMMQELGLNKAALEEATKAVAIARQQKNDALLASALTQLTSSQYALCEFMNARRSIEEVQSLNLTNQPKLPLAIMAEAYGFSLAATGNLEHARVCLEKTWQFMRDGGTAFHKAQCLNALGVLNTLRGSYPIAIEQLRQALDAQSVIGKGRRRLGLVISQNLASALAKAGENRNAKAELESIIRMMAKQGSPDPAILSQVYGAIGEICIQLKELPQAEAYLKKSIDVAVKTNDDAVLWRDYTNMARAQLAQGLPATEALTSAASHFRSPQAGAFFTAEQNPYPATRDELASELVSMLLSANMLEQAFITAEQLKEEAFISEWQKNSGEVKSTDRELYNDLVIERAHLHAAEASRTPNHMLGRWQDWMRRHQLLAADNRELARLISPVPLNLQELVGKAQSNQVTILDYLIGPKLSFVFTIDRQGRLSAAKLGVTRDQLKAQVNAMHQASAKSGPEARAAEKRLLQALYNELLPEHVQKFMPQNPDQLVAIVPDSVLFNLPFAALVDNQGRYVVESHTLTTLPAVLSFMDNGVTYSADQSIVFNAGNETQGSRESAEAGEIAQLFQPDQVLKLVGKDSDISQLQEQAKVGNPVLHFSAPFLLQDNNLFKASLPMQVSSGTTPAEKRVSADTLFRSTLPSDLAVWSGTSINTKDSIGGGVKILSRGLAYAGVRNVLLSLWVDGNQQRTEELAEFYRGRQQGLTQAQSLRKAQLISLGRDPSPRSWAAFQLIGNGK